MIILPIILAATAGFSVGWYFGYCDGRDHERRWQRAPEKPPISEEEPTK